MKLIGTDDHYDVVVTPNKTEKYVQIIEDITFSGAASGLVSSSLGNGRFSTALYSHYGPGGVRTLGPESVTIDEAIEWARARASIIVVMVCDDASSAAWFSVGDHRPPPDWFVDVRDWPEDGDLERARRIASGRDFEHPHKDATWTVDLTIHGRRDPQPFTAAWAAALHHDSAIRKVLEWVPLAANATMRMSDAGEPHDRGAVPAPPLARVRVLLTADDPTEAEQVGREAGERARDNALAFDLPMEGPVEAHLVS